MISIETAGIFRGEVVHKRVKPVEHKLKYRVFSLLLDIDQVADVAANSRLFSYNRFNLFSLKDKDHGNRDGSAISKFAWETTKKALAEDKFSQVKRIRMLFYPRIFGFAFNPLTVYFCENQSGAPVLMIYEVRNTFGENLTYVLEAGEAHNGTFVHQCSKRFYVSPFNKVDGDYTFHTRAPDDALVVGVALKNESGPVLRTHFAAKRYALNDRALLAVFFAYPLMTLKVVAGIHLEALKLWRKGLTLKERPAAPDPNIVFHKNAKDAAGT